MMAVKSTMTPMLMKNQVELSFLKPRSVSLSFWSFCFSSCEGWCGVVSWVCGLVVVVGGGGGGGGVVGW